MEFDERHLTSIPSTNSYAKEHLAEFNPEKITLIRADEQTAGRGRQGHSWHSSSHKDLILTFVFSFGLTHQHMASLGQLLSFSAAILCRSLGLSPQVKWPNDILIQNKKIAGVLCETVAQGNQIIAILGIGLNVNTLHQELCSIDQPCTSLALELGYQLNLDELTNLLKREFAKDLELFLAQGFAPFADFYQEMLSFQGQEIKVTHDNKLTAGLCMGIRDDGLLLVETADGQIVALANGSIVS